MPKWKFCFKINQHMTRIKCHMTTLELIKFRHVKLHCLVQSSEVRSRQPAIACVNSESIVPGPGIRTALWCQQSLCTPWEVGLCLLVSLEHLFPSVKQPATPPFPPMPVVLSQEVDRWRFLSILPFVAFSASTTQILPKVKTLQWSSSFYIHWDQYI